MAETNEVLSITNRSGNSLSHEGAADEVDCCLEDCVRSGFQQVFLRGDTAAPLHICSNSPIDLSPSSQVVITRSPLVWPCCFPQVARRLVAISSRGTEGPVHDSSFCPSYLVSALGLRLGNHAEPHIRQTARFAACAQHVEPPLVPPSPLAPPMTPMLKGVVPAAWTIQVTQPTPTGVLLPGSPVYPNPFPFANEPGPVMQPTSPNQRFTTWPTAMPQAAVQPMTYVPDAAMLDEMRSERTMTSCMLFSIHPLLAFLPRDWLGLADDDEDLAPPLPPTLLASMMPPPANYAVPAPAPVAPAPTGILTFGLGFGPDGLMAKFEWTKTGLGTVGAEWAQGQLQDLRLIVDEAAQGEAKPSATDGSTPSKSKPQSIQVITPEVLPMPTPVSAMRNPLSGVPRMIRTVGEDGLERIGVDFNIDVTRDPVPAIKLTRGPTHAPKTECTRDLTTNTPVAPKEETCEQQLTKKISLDYNLAPLSQVIDDLREKYGVNICIDVPALEMENISINTNVTFKVTNITMKSALNRLLHNARLTYTITDEVILITTPAQAGGALTMTTYPIGDILDCDLSKVPSLAGEYKNRTEKAARVVKFITAVEPKRWLECGGPGTLEFFPGSQYLMVNQTPAVHEMISTQLMGLRRTLWKYEDGDVQEQATKLIGDCHAAMNKGNQVKAAHLARRAFAVCPGMVVADGEAYRLHLLDTWHKTGPDEGTARLAHAKVPEGCPGVKIGTGEGSEEASEEPKPKPKCCCPDGKCECKTCACTGDKKCCEKGPCECKGCPCKAKTSSLGDSDLWDSLIKNFVDGTCHDLCIGNDGVRCIMQVQCGKTMYRVQYDHGKTEVTVMPMTIDDMDN